jgi:uncharacterized protein
MNVASLSTSAASQGGQCAPTMVGVMHGPEATVEVGVAVMHMRWEQLTFIHGDYDPDRVQRLLPAGLSVQTFDDRAWVSLVPFVMRVVLPGTAMRLPFIGRFPETNVRTYVTAEDGTEGIWFFSLDAGSALATLGGRVGYRLPYMWSAMSVEGDGVDVRYRCRRRLPGPRGASSIVDVRVGERLELAVLTERDHWLSARWRLYSHMFGRVWSARAVHEPWPLRTARLTRFDDRLIEAAGLPAPNNDPIVHYAESVSVRVSAPQFVRPE